MRWRRGGTTGLASVKVRYIKNALCRRLTRPTKTRVQPLQRPRSSRRSNKQTSPYTNRQTIYRPSHRYLTNARPLFSTTQPSLTRRRLYIRPLLQQRRPRHNTKRLFRVIRQRDTKAKIKQFPLCNMSTLQSTKRYTNLPTRQHSQRRLLPITFTTTNLYRTMPKNANTTILYRPRPNGVF